MSTRQVVPLRKLGAEIAGPGQLDREVVLSTLNYGTKLQVLAALKQVELSGALAGEMHLAEAVKEQMGHQDNEICAAAVRAMGAMGLTALKYSDDMATYLLKHPSAACRRATVDALAKLGTAASGIVIGHVGECLRDADPSVRQSAIHAVRGMGATEHAETIQVALSDASPMVRSAAIETLGHMISSSEEVQSSYANNASFAKTLSDLLANPQTRCSALMAVHNMKGKAPISCADAVVAALADKDALTRRAAASAVGDMAGEVAASSSSMSKLQELLKDSDAGVRAAAAHAVGAGGHHFVSLAPVVAELLEDESEDTSALATQIGTGARRPPPQLRFPKCAALTALGKIREPEHIKGIGAALSHENWEVRAVACEALGTIGASAVGELGSLSSATEDTAYPVRAAACAALGELQSAEAVGTLVERLTDPAPTVRLNAVTALGRLRSAAEEYSHDVFKLLDDPSAQVIAAAAVCLANMGQVGQGYAGVIANMLFEGNADLRIAALEALSVMGSYGAAFGEEIFDRLYNDPSGEVRRAADSTLAALGLLVDPLAEAIEDGQEGEEAVRPAKEATPVGPAPVVDKAAHFEGLGLYYAEIQEKKKELQSSGKWVEGLF